MMGNEALVYWREVRRIRQARRAGRLTAEAITDARVELVGIVCNTEWTALQARANAAIMEFSAFYKEAAA